MFRSPVLDTFNRLLESHIKIPVCDLTVSRTTQELNHVEETLQSIGPASSYGGFLTRFKTFVPLCVLKQKLNEANEFFGRF